MTSLTGLLNTPVSLSSVLQVFELSPAIAIEFGWYPAKKGARLNPIDVLRYE